MDINNNFEKLHEEHRDWMEEITAWHNELIYYNRVLLRLLEGAKASSDTEQMEQFKSRFDVLEDQFKITRKKIEVHEKYLARAGEDGHAKEHASMGEQMRDFKKKFLQLKNDFYVFEEKFIYE
jgi:hypothetical protein